MSKRQSDDHVAAIYLRRILSDDTRGSAYRRAVFFTTLVANTTQCNAKPRFMHEDDWNVLKETVCDFHSTVSSLVVLGTIAVNLESEVASARKVILDNPGPWDQPSKLLGLVIACLESRIDPQALETLKQSLSRNIPIRSACRKESTTLLQTIVCTLVCSRDTAYTVQNPLPPGADDFLPRLRDMSLTLSSSIATIVQRNHLNPKP
jgi:hypothetical protein